MEELNIQIHDIVSGCLDDHPPFVDFRPRCYFGLEDVYVSDLEIDDELLPLKRIPNIEEGKEVMSELFPSLDVDGKECQPVDLNCAQLALRTVRPQSYASSEGDWALFIRTATQNPPAFLRAPLVKLLTNGDF
jgi:hypothetical protein